MDTDNRQSRDNAAYLPCKHEADKGAYEDEDLIKHGRMGPLDGTMKVILAEKRDDG